ncbi:MAG: adenylate/guanylate cyclase domain-containing protein [Cyanobacteria bacterium P01_F01_bin.53]
MNPIVHPQIQRTLAAIVVTDAVGFSKHMSQDEDRALAIINRDLRLIGELCDFFEGQILKTVGDGVLMYFVSAVQAAACAVEMQKTFAGFAKTGQENDHFTHRVGVHLGDIFFNQQDMMGTGVNIAARLESEANPGGICMSQVVYDVVKSRLDLDASYIGELSLKNIDEAIAAYHVWPVGMRPEETTEGNTEAIAPLIITPLNVALQTLSEHPNSRRIKKLLYGTHKAVWENDPNILESVPLKMLLESLTDRNPTIQECHQSLYQIVGTLNRQEEYSQVAEVILDSLEQFYTLPTQTTAETSEDGEPSGILETPRHALYQDIADRLDQSSEVIRLRKMLYCLCYDSWENDSGCILKIKTITLIETLYQQITTIQGLQNRLRAILLRLNRKAKYAPIADTIFKECQVLYPEGNSQISMPGSPDSIALDDTTSDNTKINLRKKSTKRWVTDNQNMKSPMVSSVLIRSAAFGN